VEVRSVILRTRIPRTFTVLITVCHEFGSFLDRHCRILCRRHTCRQKVAIYVPLLGLNVIQVTVQDFADAQNWTSSQNFPLLRIFSRKLFRHTDGSELGVAR